MYVCICVCVCVCVCVSNGMFPDISKNNTQRHYVRVHVCVCVCVFLWIKSMRGWIYVDMHLCLYVCMFSSHHVSRIPLLSAAFVGIFKAQNLYPCVLFTNLVQASVLFAILDPLRVCDGSFLYQKFCNKKTRKRITATKYAQFSKRRSAGTKLLTICQENKSLMHFLPKLHIQFVVFEIMRRDFSRSYVTQISLCI